LAGPSPSPTATAGPATCEVQFADVPPGSTFYAAVKCLACRNVVSGYPCGTSPSEPCDGSNSPYYRPGYSITRGQISKIVAEAAGFEEDPGAQVFEDVPPGSPFYTWVNRLAQRGIVSGYGCGGPDEMRLDPCVGQFPRPYFRPGEPATRGQLAKIVANAAYLVDPVPDDTRTYADVWPGEDFYVYVERLSARHVMGGYPCGFGGEPCDNARRPYFRPGWEVSRGQAAKIVSNTFMPACSLP
jgi:S-layer homology domain